MERDLKFYSEIFSIEFQKIKPDGLDMVWFSFGKPDWVAREAIYQRNQIQQMPGT